MGPVSKSESVFTSYMEYTINSCYVFPFQEKATNENLALLSLLGKGSFVSLQGNRKGYCFLSLTVCQLLTKKPEGKVVKTDFFQDYCNRRKEISIYNWAQFQIKQRKSGDL